MSDIQFSHFIGDVCLTATSLLVIVIVFLSVKD